MIKPLNLFTKPTPIDLVVDFLPGVHIHIKRDDLTGLITSGNKIRKLEYLLADALNKKCNIIITCGAIQSNHVRATMFCCANLGLKGVAVLKGEAPETYEGNLLLDYLFGSQFFFLTPEEYDKREEFINQLCEDYKKKGERPYYIPSGGSNGIGALGYVKVIEEIGQYIKDNEIDSIFCAVGSGGTYAGLLLGKYLYGVETPLYGILVDETIEYFKVKIERIIKESCELLGEKIKVQEEDIKLVPGYIGPGYGIPYFEEIKIIKELSKKGIILDPVYTGKTFYGMVNESDQLKYKNPLFIHTGGIFSIFAYKEAFKTKNSQI